ncbi:MAG: hypothetical protein DRJ10_09480 [Bacteroidetes bacterium]|nr:MAG: hypothetical protein DRJ10_09480 [Bacteroidota bacterium]
MEATKLLVKFCVLLVVFVACTTNNKKSNLPWEKHGKLIVNTNSRIIQHKDGTPFLWLGCTAWGMTEWLSREDVDIYLDDRKSKGMNIVQLCLFWGKRKDYPTNFYLNPENQYGDKAFVEVDSFPNVLVPAIKKGGSTTNPNDYWDHVDYCLKAIKQRGMYAAILPFWGRRYVNATHKGQSKQVFTAKNIKQYGEFLGMRYGDQPHIIWVNGGDVKAGQGGDFVSIYRLFAEGLAKGITGKDIKWNEKNPAWDEFLMTYHPDGAPLINSSEWFHNDPWLDFNMIETHVNRDMIPASIRKDLAMKPIKPTVIGEGHYEGETNGRIAKAIHIRRQLYQTFFSGGAGNTYGGGFDEQGNGPLFSPTNNWKHLLEWEGAGQIIHIKKILQENKWWNWQPVLGLISEGKNEGELEKLVVKSEGNYLVYFPEHTNCIINLKNIYSLQWFNPKTGELLAEAVSEDNKFVPPDDWEDAVLILMHK